MEVQPVIDFDDIAAVKAAVRDKYGAAMLPVIMRSYYGLKRGGSQWVRESRDNRYARVWRNLLMLQGVGVQLRYGGENVRVEFEPGHGYRWFSPAEMYPLTPGNITAWPPDGKWSWSWIAPIKLGR